MSNNKFSGEIREFPRASLFMPAPETERERSSMQFSILNGNPRISVWTRVPSDAAFKAPIAGGFSTIAMLDLLDAMTAVFEGPAGGAEVCTVEGFAEGNNGERPDGPRQKVVKSEVKYGKDNDGICWISVEDKINVRPQIVFKITSDFFHNFRDRNGPLTEAAASQRKAVGLCRYLAKVFIQYDRGVTPEEKKAFADQRQQRNGGGGRQGGNNFSSNGGGKRPSTTFGDTDDDIPF